MLNMNKKVFIFLGSLLILLVVVVAISKWPRENSNAGQYFFVSTWTATSSGSQGPITYTVRHVPEGYVYSMSGSFGTVSATTSSTENPFTSCQDQFNTTKPEPKNNDFPLNQRLVGFNDSGYGFSFEYPPDWLIRKENTDFRKSVSLSKKNHIIEISKLSSTSYAGGSICDQNDYYLIKMGTSYVARSKKSETVEEGGQQYLGLCALMENGCDFTIKLSNDEYVSITYMLKYRGDTFDPALLDEMDSIVGTIQPTTN